VTETPSETPAERLARWTATDAAIGLAAETEQLHAQIAERQAEVTDLRARLAQLTNRVAQVEADNADLRRAARRVSPLGLTRTAFSRAYRRLRSAVGSRLKR
jgi:chromosome segregation ATPase